MQVSLPSQLRQWQSSAETLSQSVGAEVVGMVVVLSDRWSHALRCAASLNMCLQLQISVIRAIKLYGQTCKTTIVSQISHS